MGVKIVLVGAGGYGRRYLESLLEIDENHAQLIGVVDPDIQQIGFKEVLHMREVSVFESSEACYRSNKQIDLVIIASPIHTHYHYVVEALEHGCDVLCEKPVTLEKDLFDDLVLREKRTGRFVAVGFQQCFSPALQDLKADILNGIFGRPIACKSLFLTRREDHYYHRNSWAGKIQAGGQNIFDSPLSNGCSHQLQTMLFLLGPSMPSSARIKLVEGRTYQGRPTIENFDGLAIRVTTQEGCEILFSASHAIKSKKVGPMNELRFELATITSDGPDWKAVFTDGRVHIYRKDSEHPMQKLHAVITHIQEQTKPVCTLETVRSHLEVVLATQTLERTVYTDSVRCEEDGDGYWAIEHLEPNLLDAYETWRLPL